MMRAEVQQHLAPFKDAKVMKTAAMNGDLKKLDASIQHGFKIDTIYNELYGFSRHKLD